uniref:Uncharacterized protein n=1 Tax=Cacopsylla melanoneura TaxID=428564 RepID=A0A8D8UMX6_9HEMI
MQKELSNKSESMRTKSNFPKTKSTRSSSCWVRRAVSTPLPSLSLTMRRRKRIRVKEKDTRSTRASKGMMWRSFHSMIKQDRVQAKHLLLGTQLLNSAVKLKSNINILRRVTSRGTS